MWNRTENQIELYLIRHGMTPGNAEHRYIGRQTDEPLSEDGRQQLEKKKRPMGTGMQDMGYAVCICKSHASLPADRRNFISANSTDRN